jgi:hypothetical protein
VRKRVNFCFLRASSEAMENKKENAINLITPD